MNATCADNRALAAVIARNQSCFAPCPHTTLPTPTPPQSTSGKVAPPTSAADEGGEKAVDQQQPPRTPVIPYNTSSMCFLQCVFGTMFGSDDGTVLNRDKAMAAEDIVDPWVSAFDQKMGCPPVAAEADR